MKWKWFISIASCVLVIGALTLSWAQNGVEKHPEVDFTLSCLDCHRDMTPDITSEWEKGMHGQVNVGCFICHGDGEVKFYAKPGDDTCMTCHSAQETDFSNLEVSNCFSCHNGHNLKFHQ